MASPGTHNITHKWEAGMTYLQTRLQDLAALPADRPMGMHHGAGDARGARGKDNIGRTVRIPHVKRGLRQVPHLLQRILPKR